MNSDRRTVLKLLGAVAVTAFWPLRALAEFVRPDKAFEGESMQATFAGLGGTPEKSADVILETPEIAENGAVVPVSVSSKIPGTEQLWILIEKNPNPLAAGFQFPDHTEPFAAIRVKVAQTCNIYAVARAKGKLYMAGHEVKVTLGGCGG
ncbi:MAG: thiosulfate oxidation carrier protein SoxY [Salinisphaera sp.]|nr:thiosulfate oxidation carrier protein SoxY [Salinisphaera sp.]